MRVFLVVAIVLTSLVGLATGVGAAQHAQESVPAFTEEPPPPRPLFEGIERLSRLPEAAPDYRTTQAGALTNLPTWARLVYQSARNLHDWEVYVADADGANAAPISNHPAMDIHPRLNRGASRVVFASDRAGNDFEIYRMASDGSGLTPVTDNQSDDVAPAWSPDGTRIVFQSYRDGQPEIYVMSHDGSGQTRLTNNPDFDGMPAWSPDGAQIAFVSRRNGQYRIWLMAPDGSNQRQVSSQPYSARPVWSPDGSQIAFDADGNGDGWQELWLMNADGSQQRPAAYNPFTNTDFLAGSWSPDGRAIAFTRVSYIYYQGDWYWTSALMQYVSVDNPWAILGLAGSEADWHPALETADIQPPTSTVSPLPAQSPAPFVVSWSGEDMGLSGISTFDVQVKEGSGPWSDWQTQTLETSLSYPGIGGRRYAFRVRARDHAGNVEPWPATPDAVTTVEALPPVSSLAPLPSFSRRNVPLRWSGDDPGGSGILDYFVEVRQGTAGTWQPLVSGGTSTEFIFDGVPGHQYFFRVRAMDHAQNLEPWPAGDGDTFTTVYTWAASGQVHDNRGSPLADLTIATTPEAFLTHSGDWSGTYGAYVAIPADLYTVRWEKPGYAALPPTSFGAGQDAQVQIAMPPSDNRLANWGFESAGLAPAWQAGGDFPVGVASAARHTGMYGAVLGCHSPAPQQVSRASLSALGPQFAVDRSGAIHVVWSENLGSENLEVFYARREPDGVWSQPLNISNTPLTSFQPQLALDSTGALHVIWSESAWVNTGWETRLLYAQRTIGGAWTPPAVVTVTQVLGHAQLGLVADGRNVLHVIWTHTPGIYYVQRSSSGAWSSVVRVDSDLQSGNEPSMVVDARGGVHVAWQEHGGIVYAFKPADGGWTSPQRVVARAWLTSPRLAVDSAGGVHLIWRAENAEVHYARRLPSGAWSAPRLIFDRPGLTTMPSFFAGTDGVLHLLVASDDLRTTLFYLRRNSGGPWSAPEQISGDGSSFRGHMGADASGNVHVVWTMNDQLTGDWRLIYRRRQAAGAWDGQHVLATASTVVGHLQVAMDSAGRPHVVWEDNGQVFYGAPALADRAGSSFLAQALAIPAAASNPTLSFFYRFDNVTTNSGSRWEVELEASGVRSALFTSRENAPAWSHRWFDLASWAGQNVTLVFRVLQAAGELCATAHLDEVTVGSAYTDVWLSSPRRAAQPGRTVTYPIYYGNRSGVSADGVVLSHALPPGLTFVSASPPPTAASPTLRWAVGALPARSGPFAIMVTASIDAAAAPGSSLASTVTIAAATPELELANNTAEAGVSVGRVIYLPLSPQ
ncbi:MAG: hypothetical protein NZ528_07775 [Caldilineales bacterium]|nr:hypothetical protein [Caldilineales bacterium]MDW8316552.1 hypothetical protein [Anaerolineae bacterium]